MNALVRKLFVYVPPAKSYSAYVQGIAVASTLSIVPEDIVNCVEFGRVRLHPSCTPVEITWIKFSRTFTAPSPSSTIISHCTVRSQVIVSPAFETFNQS